MSPYTPEVGDYVRVSHEGTVKNVTQYGTITILLPNGRTIYFDDNEVTFEKINPPEPEWKPRDVVMDDLDELYVRQDREQTRPWLYVDESGGNIPLPEGVPIRPLRRLVPEDVK